MKRLLAVGALLTAAVVLTPGVAPASAPLDHYADHPIKVRPNATTNPTGLSPADIRAAYGYAADLTAGAGKTIAIVDAYDDPALVDSTSPDFGTSDLARFDRQYGLPDPPSFRKLDQWGGTVANVYLRKVVRAEDGGLVNQVENTREDVSQFWDYDPDAFLQQPVYSRGYQGTDWP